MKAEESALKWALKREEVKSLRQERKKDLHDVSKWRQEQHKDLQQYIADTSHATLVAELADNKDFQEFKRSAHEDANADDLQRAHDDFMFDKDYSEWMANKLRVEHAERARTQCAANLEQIQHSGEAFFEAKQHERMEQWENRMLEEQLDAGLQLMKAKQEREALMESVEHMRKNKQVPVPHGIHLAAKPQ